MAVKITKIGRGGVVKLDLEKLNLIEKALGARMVTEVGVLGSKSSRSETATTKTGYHKKGRAPADMTNAEIGLVHEKGSLSRGIPRRSFLLMPLQQKSDGLMKVRTFLWGKFLAGDHSVGSLKKAYVALGIAAENIIQKAFMTRGFGFWAPDSPQTIRRKKSSAVLIDTAQLRRSIDSRVVAK